MKGRWGIVIISANLVGLIALTFAYPQLMVAPGPLVAAHGSLEKDCFACHAPLRGASSARCIGCHTIDDIGLRTTSGVAIARAKAITPFHQGLTSQNCMACHTDHPTPALTRTRRATFSHALLNTTIREQCASCHTAPATAVHRGVTSQCTECHSQNSWSAVTIDHSKYFVLDRNHNAPCATCHTTVGNRKKYTCYGCHEHTEANIRAKHVREGISNFSNCVKCHRSARGEGEGGESREREERQ